MKKVLTLSIFLLCYFAVDAQQHKQNFIFDKSPMRLVNNRIVTRLAINGTDTIDAIFDSGIAYTLFSTSFVKKHHNKFSKQENYIDSEYDSPKIMLGDKDLLNEKIFTNTTDMIKWIDNTNCIFGINYETDRRIWEINFENNFMKIHDNDTIPPNAIIIPLVVSDPDEILANSYSCIKMPLQLICGNDTLDTNAVYMLDTGTPDAFIATLNISERLKNFTAKTPHVDKIDWLSITGKLRRDFALSYLNIPNIKMIENPSCRIMEGWFEKMTDITKENHDTKYANDVKRGTIGVDLLKHFNVFIDLKNRRLILVNHNKKYPYFSNYVKASTRLGFIFADVHIVDEIVINSPAHKAGLMFGDKIKSINGNSKIDIDYFNELIQLPNGSPVKVVVERDNKTLTFNFEISDTDIGI
jgi:hypothetical protein